MDSGRRSGKERNVTVIVSVIAVVFIASGIAMGIWSARDIREQVGRRFNEEQLIIARNVSDTVQRELNFLKKELLFLKGQISGMDYETEEQCNIIRNSLFRVLERGVWSAEVLDLRKGELYTCMPYRHFSVKKLTEPLISELPSIETIGSKTFWISKPSGRPSGMTMYLATDLAGDSRKLLLFNLKLSWLLKPILNKIKSGKTGYAWLIDGKGTFLFHPETEFIGKSAFTVRENRNRHISYDIINFLQKEKMLKGREGAGFYYSGWHRGIIGKIKKLIAFCPIPISSDPYQIWSVAIVAPIDEIEEAVRRGYYRQIFFELLMIVAVLSGASTIIFFERRWSRGLEEKIDKRTVELRKSQEKYRSLVESAEDFIFTVDVEGNFQSMNSFTANFFGGSPKEFIGKSLSSLFPEDVAAKQLKMIELVYKFRKSVRDEFELSMGEYRSWINANFMPLKDEEGEVNSVLCIARDITENKNLERQLINTEKLASMGTLAAGVAHEVNNPLGVILGFCDILLRRSEKGSQEYEDLKTIERQGLHCKQVVENLLSFARLEEGNSEHSDLNQCLKDIIRVVKHTMEMNNIELVCDFEEDIPPVRGDARQLQQVFLNLTNNALAAMNGEGILKIRTGLQRGGRVAVVKFQDNGIGIMKDDIDHIFEPFFTTKPEGEGTGLGLFVSYGIIAKYGGSIDCVSHAADSPNKNKGTTFTIRLMT